MLFEEALAEMRKGRVAVNEDEIGLSYKLINGRLFYKDSHKNSTWLHNENTVDDLISCEWHLEPEPPPLPRRFRAKHDGNPCVGAMFQEDKSTQRFAVHEAGESSAWFVRNNLTDIEFIDPE